MLDQRDLVAVSSNNARGEAQNIMQMRTEPVICFWRHIGTEGRT